MTQVEIYNSSNEKVTTLKNLYPLNQEGMILRYSKELSDFGMCRFRVATQDNMLEELGDFLVPHQYHVRIKRDNRDVWRGVITDNKRRNKDYIEVEAKEYLYYLSKILIRRDTESSAGDGQKFYRVFDSGTMASAVSTIISQAATDFGDNHIINGMTAGDVDNPNYPDGFKDAEGDPLTGAWSFTGDVVATFDFHTALYVLRAFGIYSNFDFELNHDLEFNFKKRIGNMNLGITFSYGTQGNIVDYELPRYGARMANDLIGIAATDQGTLFHAKQTDTASVNTFGLLQEVAAYSDVKNKNLLNTRLAEELRFIKNPEVSPVNLVLNENAYPLGQYDIGDTVYVKIKDHNIDYSAPRRIVGITVSLHNTGREMTVVQTNEPRGEQEE